MHHSEIIYKYEIINFAKTNPNAIIPSKRKEDGAYDIYACFDKKYIVIRPNEIIGIPTGIASAFDSKYRIVFQERGSTGIIGLKINAGLIDSGFRGEWFVLLNNTSNKTIYIDKRFEKTEHFTEEVHYPYTKAICQAKVQEVPDVFISEISYEELKNITSERGIGALGSSLK
jgi:dUTP pyrophosphatase